MVDDIEYNEPVYNEFLSVDKKEDVWAGRIPPLSIRFGIRG